MLSKFTLLQTIVDVPLYGRIATLELFRPHVSIVILMHNSFYVRGNHE